MNPVKRRSPCSYQLHFPGLHAYCLAAVGPEPSVVQENQGKERSSVKRIQFRTFLNTGSSPKHGCQQSQSENDEYIVNYRPEAAKQANAKRFFSGLRQW